ncbi:hypothetical protein KO481_24545 [Nocardia sp. NEAU-G5]|uniref:Uncharacterized protein n=1 Tax=Nocardia albiluteola TaxID=2842303 RepID=A0ABS6B310_9NOCA|nr:hypothetical protein [Nocardia albiluteola]MBU3064687.1 hypothetical protein [Nocardia albiluteola]
MAVGASLRIMRLRNLIEHPATGPGERAAAQRMLERILDKSDRARHEHPGRSYGARHGRAGRHASLEQIAEMIGQDIALERILLDPGAPDELAVHSPLRQAPADLTYTVEAAAGSIVVTIGNIPADWEPDTVDPALQSLAEALARIMNAYNHDGADTGRRFFGKVRAGGTTLIW